MKKAVTKIREAGRPSSAKDLFTAFDRSNLLAPDRAMRYRHSILTPAGSKPAADLVKDLLGRPFNANTWEAWLKTETR